MFVSNETAMDYYFKFFGFPEFKTKHEYLQFIEKEIPMIVLGSGREYFIIPRLRKLKAPQSSVRR
jgi:2-hydroxy-3-keto-5-methylthiopentenyl-1-phosphate phosphatase